MATIRPGYDRTFPSEYRSNDTSRWSFAATAQAHSFPEPYCALRLGFDLDRVGEHARDLWRHSRGIGAALDEGTERDRRLDYRRILHASLFHAAKKATRYFQGKDRWPF